MPATADASPVGEEAAARFLTQATFGPQLDEIRSLGAETSFDGWLAAQRAAPMSLQMDYLAQLPANDALYPASRVEAWWQNVANGPDQLRQRMAFALSEILVVSDLSFVAGQNPMYATYYDNLARNALGNFRTLLEDVTLSQAMGRYLSMFQNQKPVPAHGIRADENFAREVMQLFTVGLDLLNSDGTPQLDGNGQALPTYSQADIENLARVFTGWSYPGGMDDSAFYWLPDASVILPMQAYPSFHDSGAKTILDGTVLPAGLSPAQDLDAALDTLFNHPNVGPFIGRQLIQRLVTSNPSPAYVQRVALAFNDNGHGVRGDLYAVARAILLDPEARNGHLDQPEHFGKLREPLVRLVHLWRAFDASSVNDRIQYWYPEIELGQGPLRSPSVFNFFRPRFQPAGPLAEAGLVAPEFQITNETTITLTGNMLTIYCTLFRDSLTGDSGNLMQGVQYLDFRPWETRAADLPGLVADLDLVLMSGQMPDAMRQALLTYLALIPQTSPSERLREAVMMIVTSPQYAVQR